MPRRVVSLLTLAGLAVGPVRAQSPAERERVEQFRAQLVAIDDTTRLLALEAELIDRARQDRDDTLLHLQLGFLAYRLGELTGARGRYDDAASEFEWATELAPQWPYPWYGLGLAELALGEHHVIAVENLRQVLGLDYLSKAAAAFSRAAQADPAFADAVVDLAETAMQQRIRARTEVALDAVRRAARTNAGDVPAVQLARGRLEREMGDADSALAAFARYLEVGGDSGVGLLERARTLYLAGRPAEARATYYRGASMARSPAAVGLYRGDAAWVATPEELRAFDRLDPAERAGWLERFWHGRDVADARRPGERLREHYRRWFYALGHYRLVSRHRRYDVVNPYRTDQRQVDDRGVIYLRHGEPTRRATHAAPGIDPNESWLYARPGGDLVFHFAARGDVQDYKLVESLLDVFGLDSAVALQTGTIADARTQALFESRIPLHPVYQRLAYGSSAGAARLLGSERGLGGRSIRVGTITDSYRVTFERELESVVRHYVVGAADAGGSARLLVVCAVAGRALASQPVGGDRVAYPLDMRVAVEGADGPIALLDTTRVFSAPRALRAGEHLTAFVEVPLPAGRFRVRTVLAQPGQGVGRIVVDTIAVEFPPRTLALSDVVLGRRGTTLLWVAAAGIDTVALEASGRYPAGSTLEVYYEIHGLAPGTPYRGRVEVEKVGGRSVFGFLGRLFGGGPPIAVEFDGVTTRRPHRVLQRVDLAPLAPGTYRLRVAVEADEPAAGRERVLTFEVVR